MRMGLIVGGLVIGVPMAAEILRSPFWGVAIGIIAGINAYYIADRKYPGYPIVVLFILLAPVLLQQGTYLPWSDISTGAIVFTFLALAIVFDPGEFVRFMKWSRQSRSETSSRP